MFVYHENSGRTPRSTVYGSVAVILIILNAVFIFGLFGCPKMEISWSGPCHCDFQSVELFLCMMENWKWSRFVFVGNIWLVPIVNCEKTFYRYTTPVYAQ